MLNPFRRRRRKLEEVEQIVQEEFSDMTRLQDHKDRIHVTESLGFRVDYHSSRDHETFYYFMFNLSDSSSGVLEQKTAYQRQINVGDKGKGYGRELIEAGERICKRLGVVAVKVDDPFDSPTVWNQNPSFWEYMGYTEGQKSL